MSSCRNCTDHNNPFKYGYAPLWFAWRPVMTDNGVAFLTKVHRIQNMGLDSGLIYTHPTLITTYEKCSGIYNDPS